MIYRGYAIFRISKGKIINVQEEFEGYYGSLVHIGDRMIICLNKDDSQGEKIKTVIHEFLHLGYESGTKEWDLNPRFPFLNKEQREILDNLEDRVKAETEKVLQCQPILVKHIREMLIRAAENNQR